MCSTSRRSGLTVVEVIAVLAILLILGSMISYSFRNTERDTKVKAGGDIIRTKIAEGRAAAIEDARPYRLTVSPDERTIRVEPDDQTGGDSVIGEEDPPFIGEEELPKEVTARLVREDGSAPVLDTRGWTRVVTFLPDGTCREDSTLLEIRQPGIYALNVRIRGLTGSVNFSKGDVVRKGQ